MLLYRCPETWWYQKKWAFIWLHTEEEDYSFNQILIAMHSNKKNDTKVRGGSNQTWSDNGWTWLLQELAKSVAKLVAK